MTFKVGDRVKWSSSDPCPERYEGKDLTVTSISDKYLRMNGEACGFYENEFTLVPVAAKPAPIDPAKKYRTRDGREVLRILCADAPGEYPVIALVQGFTHRDEYFPVKRTSTGTESYERDGGGDLIPAPVEHEGWVNVYHNGGGLVLGAIRESRDDAENHTNGSRVACIHVKFVEGEGLNDGV